MSTPAEDIPFLLQEYNEEARAIEKSLIELIFYMRGSINLEQAYTLTPKQRKYAYKLIKDNLEKSKKMGGNFI